MLMLPMGLNILYQIHNFDDHNNNRDILSDEERSPSVILCNTSDVKYLSDTD